MILPCADCSLKALAVARAARGARAARRLRLPAPIAAADRRRRRRSTGLSAPIDIVRDADAIPHIFAANKLDALFGLGYVHAQDRLWQMEFQRRIGHGRLSEVFGAATLPQDRFLRTVGFGRAARAAWASTPDWAQAAGQRVRRRRQRVHRARITAARLPPEFTLLRFEPEPWTGRGRHRLGEDDGVGSERATTRSSCCATTSLARGRRRSGWRS